MRCRRQRRSPGRRRERSFRVFVEHPLGDFSSAVHEVFRLRFEYLYARTPCWPALFKSPPFLLPSFSSSSFFFPPRIAKDQPSIQIVIHLDRFPFRDSNFNSRGSTWTQIFPQSMNSWFFFLLIQSY